MSVILWYVKTFTIFNDTYKQIVMENEEETSGFESSPFLDIEHPITLYEGIKLIFMVPFAMIRLILILFILFMVYIPSAMVVIVLDREGHLERGEPLGRKTRKVLDIIIGAGARTILFIAGFYWVKKVDNIKNKSKRSVPDLKYTMVYNHVSYCDPIVLLGCVTSCSGVAKSGVATIPLVGKITVALQYIFISRKGSNDTINKFTCTNMEPQEAVNSRSCMPEGFPAFAIAPEATTKPKECLLKFRKGAFVPGKPVIPVLLKYPCKHFHVGWGIPWNDAFHVWRFLSQVVHHCEIEILDPYYPSIEEQDDPILYANNVRMHMGSLLNVDLVDSDVKEECKLRKIGVSTTFRGTKIVLKPN